MRASVPILCTAVGPHTGQPLLLLGTSLGTSSRDLWSDCGAQLARSYDLIAWELPGHGGAPSSPSGFDMEELAQGALSAADEIVAQSGRTPGSYLYAGVSIGGAVGLQLMLDSPDRVVAVAALCTGAKINESHVWVERAAQVRSNGTVGLLERSVEVWFAPGFPEAEPERSARLLHALATADPEGYAQLCEALAVYDVRARLPEIQGPVLAVAGGEDRPTPVGRLEEIARGVQHGRLVMVEGGGHLAVAERPEEVARLLTSFFDQQ